MVNFWNGKKVFLTGHTGFKGQWMAAYLRHLGAHVYGYSMPPEHPVFYLQNDGDAYADINSYGIVKAGITKFQPDVVIHMAAQAVVSIGYGSPLRTLETNIMGTANVLQAAHKCQVPATLIVTSDKCYDNDVGEVLFEYDRMGGNDPYSVSKGCAELITKAYAASYDLSVGTVRGGNVIGGGDWAKNRLIPDMARALMAGERPIIRKPHAARPFQHVLDVIHGYLLAAQHIYENKGYDCWNIAPDDRSYEVKTIAEIFMGAWNTLIDINYQPDDMPEASTLELNAEKATRMLGWNPRYDITESLQLTADWYKAYMMEYNMLDFTMKQVENYAA